MGRVRLALLAVAMAIGLAAPAVGEPPLRDADGPVNFAPRAGDRTDGLERMPRVVANAAVSAAAAARINAALRREDARTITAARDCRGSDREMRGKDNGPAWSRSVAVTMAGPRYLAYQVRDSYYCGGPYPNDGMRSDFVYDLATGSPVNWLRLFPAGAEAKGSNSSSGAGVGLVVWRELTRRAATRAEPECRDALKEADYAGFTIGLDARTGTLTAEPAEFPHVIQACADELALDVATLRRLGFAPQLAAAIDAAHRLQRSPPARCATKPAR